MSLTQKKSFYWILFIFFIIGFVLVSLTFDLLFLINFAHDDSFFYLKIAKNISEGYGSTFDQITITNGYHPLWLMILTPLFSLINFFGLASPEFLYRIVFSIHWIMAITIVFLLFRTTNYLFENKFQFWIILNLIFALTVFVFIRDVGMESMLSCLMFSVFLYLKSKEIKFHKNYIYAKFFLIIFIVLVRIDYAIFLATTLVVADLVSMSYSIKLKLKLAYFFGPIFIYIIFAAINYLLLGSPSTVASSIVSTFPQSRLFENIELLTSPAYRFNQLAKLIILVSLSFFPLLMSRLIKIPLFLINRFLSIFLIGVLLTILVHLFFNKYSIREWYLTFPLMVSCVNFIFFLVNINKKLLILSTVLTGILFISVFYLTRLTNLKYNSIYSYSKKIEKVTNKDANIFTFDWMGIIGFFSNRKIFTGDGFAADYEYIEYLKTGNAVTYMLDKNFDFYSTFLHSKIQSDHPFFSDEKNSSIFKTKNLVFRTEDVVLEYPISYNHSTASSKGYFYLVKVGPDIYNLSNSN